MHRAYWIGVALGIFTAAGTVLEKRAEIVHGADFSGFWAGARAILAGADPYDAATWVNTTAMLATQPPDTAVYGYTPWVALAMIPLAVFPLEVAAAIWSIFSVSFAAAVMHFFLAVRPVPAYAALVFGYVLFASQPALTALMVGQWSFVLVGALTLVVTAACRGLYGLAGVALLATLAKPQLFLLAVPALLARWPAMARTAIPAGLAIVAVSWIAFPHWLDAWSRYVAPVRVSEPPRAATFGTLLFEAIGPPGPLVSVALVAVVLLAVVRRHGLSDAALACSLALSVLVAPYSWSYDQLLFIVPLALAVGIVHPDRPRAALVLTVLGAVLLLVIAPVMYAVAVQRGRETLGGLVPVLLTASVIAATWPRRPADELPEAALRSAPRG